MFDGNRREFITMLGGAATLPFAARAQQHDRVRRIGVLIGLLESDQEGQARLAAFRSGLEGLGWFDGHNIQIEYRWAGADPARLQAYAAQLVALKPDVIFAASGTPLAALHRETRVIPIVFTNANDPVADGFVASWSRPGGNISGFPMAEYATVVKSLELLKQIAPRLTRALLIYDPSHPSAVGLVRENEAAAASLGIQLLTAGVSDSDQIAQSISPFAAEPNGGRSRWRAPSQQFIAERLSISRPNIRCLRFTRTGCLSPRADLHAIALIFSNFFAARQGMSIASSRARTRPTFRCRRRPSTNW
jgi:putative ABC transport system substrate-binding protein